MRLLVDCLAAVILVFASRSAAVAGAADAQRSFKAEVLFRLAHPCPSTGEVRGECRGYVIDRIVPIVCGGAEDPGNMQWQTLAQAREKNRWERIGCRPGRTLVMPGKPAIIEAYPLPESSVPLDATPLPSQ